MLRCIVTIIVLFASGCCPEFVYDCDKEQADKANSFIEKCLESAAQKGNRFALQNCTGSAQEIFCTKKRVFK